jgi:hypothetical protein
MFSHFNKSSYGGELQSPAAPWQMQVQKWDFMLIQVIETDFNNSTCFNSKCLSIKRNGKHSEYCMSHSGTQGGQQKSTFSLHDLSPFSFLLNTNVTEIRNICITMEQWSLSNLGNNLHTYLIVLCHTATETWLQYNMGRGQNFNIWYT